MAKFVGSIPLIGGITPKNGGGFPLVDAKDIQVDDNGKRLDEALSEIGGTKTASVLPDDGIAAVDVMYFLGEVTELSIGFPVAAALGDMSYLSFYSGAAATKVTVTTPNTVGITDQTFYPDRFYELIGMWNGDIWVFVVHWVAI